MYHTDLGMAVITTLVLQQRRLSEVESLGTLYATPCFLFVLLIDLKKENIYIYINLGNSIYDVAFRYQSHRNGVNYIFSRVIGSYFAKETLYFWGRVILMLI